ncbi:calcium-binding protein [Nitrosomonas sp. Nm84]|uniref:calcium-binding protein n=1 Tax=Nitrosomonas sp. Nm84 TaxID=200124 RepID=UPI0014048D16|nr:calcium-binding protein [Nitrosomonas sp. Nm84]
MNGTGSLNDTVTYVSATTGVTVSLLDTSLQNTIGAGFDTEILNQGTDSVSTNLSYTLLANVENLTLTDASVINGMGNAQANIIIGNAAVNQLSGNAGNDKLDGKAGNNVLTGGTGNDIFKFTTKGHIDTITDYNVANDTIQLENAIFTALTTTGTLAATQFRVGTKALDPNDFIIYNKTAGTLFYDSDGNGVVAATQIATVGSGLNLTNADIIVV